MRNKFTKQAQTALTLAKAAAIDFELGYIGTEHLLLGLLSETEGAAGRVLEEFQVDGKKPCSARRTVLEPGFYIRWE